MEEWFLPNTASAPPEAQSVLVLAPHPDDEVFGCGGCIALYARAGAKVHVHILTDGGGYLQGEARAQAVATRQAESRRAADLLGVAQLSFGTGEDRRLDAVRELPAHVAVLIRQAVAQVVFAPSLWEVHPDHRTAAWAAVQACLQLQAAGEAAPAVAFFEVGAPQRPNTLVDISAVAGLKRRAMEVFSSQLAQQPYDRHIGALNTFRTYSLPGVDAAEALYVLAPRQLAHWAAAYGEQGEHMPGLAAETEGALQQAHLAVESLQLAANEQREQMAALLRRADEARAKADQAEVALGAVTLERNAVAWERDHARAETAQLRNDLAGTQERLAATQQQLQAIHQSLIWRATKPLRWLRRQFGKP